MGQFGAGLVPHKATNSQWDETLLAPPLVNPARMAPEIPSVVLQLPFEGGPRRIAEADIVAAIEGLKNTTGDIIPQTLRHLRSPLYGCLYHEILAPYQSEARTHPYATQFSTAKGLAPSKAAFLLALERRLDAERTSLHAEVLKVWQLMQRFVRDSAMVREVKQQYDYRCQLGCEPFTAPQLSFVEGAHIHPLRLGGPDEKANILVLCPNHHVLFDYGAFYIDAERLPRWSPSFSAHPSFTQQLVVKHEIDPAFFEFHRIKIAKVK